MSSTRIFVCGAAEMNGNQEYLGVERALGPRCPLPSALWLFVVVLSTEASSICLSSIQNHNYTFFFLPFGYCLEDVFAVSRHSILRFLDPLIDTSGPKLIIVQIIHEQLSQYHPLWSDGFWQKLGDQPDRWEAKSRNIQWRRRVHAVLQVLFIQRG